LARLYFVAKREKKRNNISGLYLTSGLARYRECPRRWQLLVPPKKEPPVDSSSFFSNNVTKAQHF
jgi:hypothetical protein